MTLDPLELLAAVLADAASLCPANVSLDLRDLKTLRSRVKDEGLSFLTITLPAFAKGFEQALATGQMSHALFPRWKRCGAGPAFLRGLLGQIFDYETGRLHEQNHDTPTLVAAIRQVCLLFKKVALPCSPERDRAAVENFVHVESLNKEFRVDAAAAERFAAASHVLWNRLLAGYSASELVPRHGPGATAERVLGNQKYVWQRWHKRLDDFMPYYEYAYAGDSYGCETVEDVTYVSRDKEAPVRVTLVPKTLKAPRVIAIEPACMQYAQQAVQKWLYGRLETNWPTKGHVNFTDQSINQDLALTSSLDSRFATIDLSDASDRVIYSLAMQMFQVNPELEGLIRACRSESALLPDGRVIGPLAKFASMGSALCFPVEAMYFYTACVVALLVSRNLPTNKRTVRSVCRDVYVYGDDILVPTHEAGTVIDYLQKYNCKVNASKTFLTGNFRESCGTDAYAGREVTPTYLRHMCPRDRQQPEAIVSWMATANHFQKKGYVGTASLMFCTLERILGKLPQVSEDSPGLGRISYYGERLTTERWNAKYQRLEIRAWTPCLVYRSDRIDGYPALTKSLLGLERVKRSGSMGFSGFRWSAPSSSGADRLNLERTAQRGAVSLKRRWVPLH